MGVSHIKKVVSVFMLFVLTVAINADDYTGTQSMDFLALTHSVKSESLGGAVTAISDSRSMNVNPSCIAKTGGIDIQTHYLSYIESMHFANVSAVIPIKKTVLGFNVGWMDFGRQTRTTMTDKTGAKGDTFSSKGLMVAVSAARSFSKVDVGLGVKNVLQTLDSQTSDAVGLAAGVTVHVSPWLSLGSSLSNVTLKQSVDGNLQEELRVGMGYNFENKKVPVVGTVDVLSRFDGKYHVSTGLQYEMTPVFSVRAGYTSLSDIAPFSAGIGLNLPQVHIDFSYRPSREFGSSYRVGIGVQF